MPGTNVPERRSPTLAIIEGLTPGANASLSATHDTVTTCTANFFYALGSTGNVALGAGAVTTIYGQVK